MDNKEINDEKINKFMSHISDYFRKYNFSAEEMLLSLMYTTVTLFWVVTNPDENGSKRERIVEMITDFVNAAIDERERQDEREKLDTE